MAERGPRPGLLPRPATGAPETFPALDSATAHLDPVRLGELLPHRPPAVAPGELPGQVRVRPPGTASAEVPSHRGVLRAASVRARGGENYGARSPHRGQELGLRHRTVRGGQVQLGFGLLVDMGEVVLLIVRLARPRARGVRMLVRLRANVGRSGAQRASTGSLNARV